MGEIKLVIKWRPMHNHHFIHLDDVFNIIVNYWLMVLHKTMIDIELQKNLLALLIPTKKKIEN